VAYSQDEFNTYAQETLAQPTSGIPWNTILGVGGPVGLGYLGYQSVGGKRIWGKYLQGLHHAEGALPMGIGATFRFSELLSPPGAPTSHIIPFHKKLFEGQGFQDYLSRVTGQSAYDLEKLGAFSGSLEWNRTGKTFGTLSVAGGGPRLASNVGLISTGPRRQGHILEWFSRTLGVSNATFLRGIDEKKHGLRPQWLPVGAGDDTEKFLGKYAHATFSWLLGRMNSLLSSPFDLEVMEAAAKKVPLIKNLKLGVKPGTGIQMLGRFGVKAGIGLLGIKSLSYLDYLSREHTIAGVPVAGVPISAATGAAVGAGVFRTKKAAAVGGLIGGGLSLLSGGSGPITGLAKLYSGAQILRSSVSHSVGLGEGVGRTEGMFDGLTQPTTLVAAAGVGLLLGGTKDYGERLQLARSIGKTQKRTQASKAVGIYEHAEKALEARREALYQHYDSTVKGSVGLEKFISTAQRELQGDYKDGKFAGRGASFRGVAIGAAAYAGLSAVGSLVSGDVGGAALTLGTGAAAALAFVKGKTTAAAGLLVAPFLLREADDPEKLKRIYSGEEEVEIKSGRFWEAGRTPYEGQRSYHRKHRIAMMQTGSREAALYGSEKKYWETDPFLNPLSFILDPYARDRAMWEQGYKFPVSAVPFEDFPMIGPLLAATLGQVIKPSRFLGKEEWIAERSSGAAPPGHENLPKEAPITRTSIRATVGEQFYRMTEAFGLPGFAMQAASERLTGNELPFPNDQYATSSLVGGLEPSWWSLNFGGAALLSESMRRYVPNRRSDVEYRNPLPSDLPSWLPGSDSDFNLDFSRADIYTKIEEPWARLPGSGYAAVHKQLKGVSPEDYPAFWRFKVLSDVANYSSEYRQYDKLMASMAAEGRLTPQEVIEVDETRRKVSASRKNKDFSAYKYNPDTTSKVRVKIIDEVEPGQYLTDTFGAAPITLAGLNTSPVSLASVARSKNASMSSEDALNTGMRKRTQMADFLREHLYPGAEVDVFVHKDPSLTMERNQGGQVVVPSVVSHGNVNLNRELIERGMAASTDDRSSPLQATQGSGRIQRMFGRFWENLAHNAETPLESFTPLAPVAKFMHQRTPLEEYQRSEVYARDVALWQKPISHFLAPGLKTTAWWAGWRGTPQDVKERYMVNEYFDRLKYLKYKRAESFASAAGMGQAASEHAGKAAQTMTGADTFSDKSIMMALPRAERAYFKAFVEAPSREERREISRVVSPQMKVALHSQWAKRAAEGARMRQESQVSFSGDLQTMLDTKRREVGMSKQPSVGEVAQGLPLPGPDWLGWSPETNIQDYKVKTVLDKEMDTSQFGIWDDDIRRVEQKPYIKPISAAFYGPTYAVPSISRYRKRYNQLLGAHGSRGPNIEATLDWRYSLDIDVPGYDRLHRYMRDPMLSDFGG